MFKALLLVTFIASLSTFATGQKRAQEVPFSVSIQSNGTHICSGSLIGSQLVLTAGNCTNKKYKVRIGSNDWSTGGELMEISEISTNATSNVAIIKLAGKVTASNAVKFIRLATEQFDEGTKANLSGWGQLNGTLADVHKKLGVDEVTLFHHGECISHLSNGHIRDFNFCALSNSNVSCSTDLGSPIVINRKIVGIASSAPKGCTSLSSIVYTSVAAVRDWIEAEIKILDQ